MSTPQPPTTRFGKFRNTLAHRIASFAMNRIATPWYRAMIGGAIALGLETAAEQAQQQQRLERRFTPGDQVVFTRADLLVSVSWGIQAGVTVGEVTRVVPAVAHSPEAYVVQWESSPNPLVCTAGELALYEGEPPF